MPQSELCTQPECTLREDCIDCENLSEMIVRALTGEPAALIPSIQRKDRCVGCVRGVLRGGKPLPTVEDVKRQRSAGKWARRRQRRWRIREARRV